MMLSLRPVLRPPAAAWIYPITRTSVYPSRSQLRRFHHAFAPKHTLLRSNFLQPLHIDVRATRHRSRHPFICQAFDRGKGEGEFQQKKRPYVAGPKAVKPLWKKVLHRLGVFVGGVLLAGALLVAALPGIASSPAGLRTVTSFVNKTIPGTVTVQSVSAGWTKPLHISGVKLLDPQQREVLSVESVSTKASLLSLATGRAGFGDLEVEGATISGLEDETTGLLRIQLAVTKPEKLPPARSPQRAKALAEAAAAASAQKHVQSVDLEVFAEMPRGGARVVRSAVVLPWDKAALAGDSIQVNVDAGQFALDRDKAVAAKASARSIPLVASARSSTLRLAAAGNADLGTSKVELVRPVEAEIEVSPATGQLILGQLNPLLRGVISREDSLPDVRLWLTPDQMALPTEEYSVRVDPMRVTLGKGDLIRGLLRLLSRGDGSAQTLPMQTTAIQAVLQEDGLVKCSRFDLLVADSVHVVTWGTMDLKKGDVSMTLAIPADTLKRTLGIQELPSDYYLQIPLVGTVEAPKVDWKTAGLRIGRLVAQKGTGAGGKYAARVLGLLKEDRGPPVPELVEELPWARR